MTDQELTLDQLQAIMGETITKEEASRFILENDDSDESDDLTLDESILVAGAAGQISAARKNINPDQIVNI